ncbi:LrgB family protein [Pantoea sp. Ap-967]|uniref:LrgB family protein n=1 Tax=Pantoea sp. Ap-967 TaxID=2608362 RepID=UPI001420B2A6|nr:LrgB family protein [Pantoea sp. Ap-967]NIE75936.1 LrgB family protein [Pantoea sp. Ap-967]
MSTFLEPVVGHPLFHLALTLIAFQAALHLSKVSGIVILQPVLVSAAVVIAVLTFAGISYDEYLKGVSILNLLLGPATVALAVPLYQNLSRIRRLLWPIVITVVLGGIVASASTLLLGGLMGIDHQLLMTLAPKSVTSPIAMLVANQAGGIAALAAVFVLLTGILGAVFGPSLLRMCRVTHPAAMGMALGLTAHAVGTSRALEEGQEHGAYAALAMSLMGVGTAIFLPLALAAI